MDLEAYIKEWNRYDQKPCNENVFIDLFIKYINSIDNSNDVKFHGDGAYFGKQVSIYKDSNYFGSGLLHFEAAYNKEAIRVYTGNHHGFWRPPYMDLGEKHERFNEVKSIFFPFLRKIFGL